jgi:hypothetical protein
MKIKIVTTSKNAGPAKLCPWAIDYPADVVRKS